VANSFVFGHLCEPSLALTVAKDATKYYNFLFDFKANKHFLTI